jgi:hypothetical protein
VLGSGGIIVRVMRPWAGWMRTTSPPARPNSSQLPVAPSSRWRSSVTTTGGGRGLFPAMGWWPPRRPQRARRRPAAPPMPSTGLAADVADRIAPCRTGRCALARWGKKRCRGSWTHHLPEGRRWHPRCHLPGCRSPDSQHPARLTASTPMPSAHQHQVPGDITRDVAADQSSCQDSRMEPPVTRSRTGKPALVTSRRDMPFVIRD